MLFCRYALLLALLAAPNALFGQEAPREIPSAAPLRSGSEPAYPPFCFVDDRGEATGLSVELMRAALRAMDRKAEFTVAPWAELKRALAEGRLDALPLVGRTPEREADFDFTFPYLTMHGAIVVRRGTGGIADLDDLRNKTIAVMEGDNAEEFLRRRGFDDQLVTTGTFAEALRQLADGRHDAVIMQRLVALHLIDRENFDNLEIAGGPLEAFKQDFCFAVREGDKELLALLNEGLSIAMANGTFDRLQRTWFAPNAAARTGEVVVIGGDANLPPYEYLDDEGRPAGFNVELTRAIARKMGMNIEIRLGRWDMVREHLARGELDALQGMFYSEERDHEVDFSQPHSIVHYVVAVRRGDEGIDSVDDLGGKDILVQNGDIMHDVARDRGYGKRIVPVANQQEALRLLSEGYYDCALVAEVPATMWMRENGWDNLRLIHDPIVSHEYCYAVPHGNPKLLARFTEGLAVLKQTGEYRKIYNKWLTVYEEPGVDMMAVMKYSAMIVGPLVGLLVLFVLWSWTLRRRVAERTAELWRSRATLQAAMDQSQAGIAIAETPDGRLNYVNDAGLTILGQKPTNTDNDRDDRNRNITPTWTFLDLDGNVIPREQTPLVQAARTGETVSGDFIVRRPDGVERTLWAKAGPIVDENGGRIAAIVVFLDVTDQREIEDRLRQSEKMQAVGQLAGGIAHDFNNQLSGVMGYGELLTRAADNDKQRRYAENIVTAARRAADLTKQLLAFGRKGKYLSVSVDVHRLLGEVVALLEHSIDKRIHMRQVLEAEHPVTMGDPSQLQNAILNVAINARDAMPDGGELIFETDTIELDASFCRKHPYDIEPGPFVRVSVTDTGCGMDRATQARVFEPFFTTKAEGEGTGMGLASVYGTVRNHHGAITVYSEPGHGTTVRIYLPQSGAAGRDEGPAHEEPPRGTARILVVDDEEVVRDLVADMLHELGYKVALCKNGREAADYYREAWREVDLVILDMVMPEMGGRDTFIAMRNVNPNVRAILASGYSINGEAQSILDEGVLGFVGKPFNRRELARAVADALSGEYRRYGEGGG